MIFITYNVENITADNPLASVGIQINVTDAYVIVISTFGLSDINYVLSGTISERNIPR